MQTFLATYDLAENAALLDGKRLFKQLVEAATILDILANKKTGAWASHPATKQWRGFEIGLLAYITSIWQECNKRGIAPHSQIFNKAYALEEAALAALKEHPTNASIFPQWWGREDILITHRSRLKCKGLLDIYCAALKKALKIKKFDDWSKMQFGKTKNELRHADALVLERMLIQKGITVPTNNHYDRKEWAHIPFDLCYIWP